MDLPPLQEAATKDNFDQSHGARELEELGPSQELLFRSPADDVYIPGTIADKATEPHSLSHGSPRQALPLNKRTYKTNPPKYPCQQIPKQ